MRKFNSTLLMAVLILSVAFVFVGCGDEAVVEETTETTFEGLANVKYGEWEIGKSGGSFVMSRFGSDPKTFNPITASETSSTDVTYRMSSYLVRRNQQTLVWEPNLADSWEIADDELSIVLTLKDGLKWSDGTPMTAEDWVYPVNNIYFEEGVEGSNASALTVNGEPTVWEALDDKRIKISFSSVYAGMLEVCNSSPVPTHIFKPLIDAAGGDATVINSYWGVDSDVSSVLSSGAFVLKEYVPGQKVVFGKNPYYYKKDEKGNQLPYVDELIFLYVEDQDTQLAKFRAGELDYYLVRGEDYAVLVDEKEALDFELYMVGPSSSTNFITYNQNPIEGEGDAGIEGPKLEWLSNKEFRYAMAHLIDRENYINNMAYGFGFPQYSFIPQFSPYYWKDVEDYAPKYDLEAAKKILDEIGYVDTDGDGFREDGNGVKVSLNLVTNSGNKVREQIGTAFAEEARKVGIEIIFKPIDFNTLVGQLLSTYDWDMILIGLTGSVDPVSGSNVYPSNGNLHMIEPNQESPKRDWEKAVDIAWDEANLTTNEDQRKSGFEKIQKIWIDENPWTYTFNTAIMEAYKTKWGNIQPQAVTYYQWDGIIDRVYLKD